MLLDCLKKVKDSRGKQDQQYDQASVLFLSVLAVLCGATSYRKIHIFIAQKFSQLKEILRLKWRKPPAYTTIRGIIHSVDEQSLEEQYRLYTQDLVSRFGHRMTGKKFAAGDGKAGPDRADDRAGTRRADAGGAGGGRGGGLAPPAIRPSQGVAKGRVSLHPTRARPAGRIRTAGAGCRAGR